MKHTPVKTSFVYPTIKPEDYRLGSFDVGEILRPDSDWRQVLSPDELQNRHGVESSACYIQAQQHCIATLMVEKFEIHDQNFAERFNALLSDGTESGGDSLKGAQSIRHYGLIKDSSMPFSDDIQSFEEFHSWKSADENACRAEGQEWLKNWKPTWKIVFEREDDLSAKYIKLKQALKKSPVPVSVTAWYQDDNGVYIKPKGETDNHLVYCVYVDSNNVPYISDTYSPFIKKLEANYDFDFAMSWSIDKLNPKSTNCFFNWLKKYAK